MSYTWTDREIITAEKLNSTSENLFIINATIDFNNSNEGGFKEVTFDKTYSQIKETIINNNCVQIIVNDDDYYFYLNLSESNQECDYATFLSAARIDQYTIQQDCIYIDFLEESAYYSLRSYINNGSFNNNPVS